MRALVHNRRNSRRCAKTNADRMPPGARICIGANPQKSAIVHECTLLQGGIGAKTRCALAANGSAPTEIRVPEMSFLWR